jgi:predicted alpha/beta hydrolase family esterase
LPIDFEKVRARAKKIVCIFSDNDPYVPAENWEMFSENLGAEIITEKSKGHFTDDDGIKELPAAFDAVLKIAQNEKK